MDARRVFPGTILARKVYSEKVRAHASSRPVAEEGANAHGGPGFFIVIC